MTTKQAASALREMAETAEYYRDHWSEVYSETAPVVQMQAKRAEALRMGIKALEEKEEKPK